MADSESMVEVFIYETRQFLSQLEQLALTSENNGAFAADDVNEIFRAMHTIKGSAAMMTFDEVSHLAHAIEDIFFYIRELQPAKIDVSAITDIVLTAVDFMNGEMDKLENGEEVIASSKELREHTLNFLREFKLANGDDPDVDLRKKSAKTKKAEPKPNQYFIPPKIEPPAAAEADGHIYKAVIHFELDCGMLEVRAFGVVNRLQDKAKELYFKPENYLENEADVKDIEENGFRLWFKTNMDQAETEKFLQETIYLQKLELEELPDTSACEYWPSPKEQAVKTVETETTPVVPQKSEAKPRVMPKKNVKEHENQVISVQVEKLDRLMDLVGEMVIAESMVIQNPDLKNLELTNFAKAARQLHKINEELQDSVMALRMVPLEGVFQKMNRIVRDMTKKLGKKAKLKLAGADTEVDKNIAEHIGDPLMHIVRNSLDHGIELPEKRQAAGKEPQGTITISAQNAGGEVIIRIEDDGAGMNREKILTKAREKGLLTKPESDYSDKEVYNFIFAAGFSTKEQVTEFSGRGVGMDVVVSNIKALGGSVSVDSTEGKGSVTTIRIPLTLAIVDGMCIRVGDSDFTIPISVVRRSFRPSPAQVILDASGSELFMERGECLPIMRLHKLYGIQAKAENLCEGILLVVEADGRSFGIFADEIIGVQQIVVKPVPKFIKQMTRTTGITGCTLLGNGSISLIIDPVKLRGLL